MRTSPQLAVPDDTKSVRGGAIKAWRVGGKNIIIAHNRILRQLAEQIPFDPDTPWRDLPERTREILLYGDASRTYNLRLKRGNCKPADVYFCGVLAEVDKLCAETSSDGLRARLSVFQTVSVCPECKGARFSARTRNVFVEGVSYDRFCAMSVLECLKFVGTLRNISKYDCVRDAVNGLYERLSFLDTVGLSYIGLDREASTLSGGEAQRARLATQLGMDLTGVTYVLDEPTIGLHPSDDAMLIGALKTLRDRGNSVLLVEHDEAALRASEWIVELGPEAGENGGRLVFNGTLADCRRYRARECIFLGAQKSKDPLRAFRRQTAG